MIDRTQIRLPLMQATLLILALSLLPSAQAHENDTSHTWIRFQTGRIEIIYSFEVGDLGYHFGLDANRDQEITGEELLAGQSLVQSFLESRSQILLQHRPATPRWQATYFTEDSSGNSFMNLVSVLDSQPGFELELRLNIFERFGRGHRNLLKAERGGETRQGVLTAADPIWSSSPANGRTRGVWGRFWLLGVEHIFLGFDHLFFLMALVVTGRRLADLVKIVTAFTLAHSLTLAVAALGWVSLPSQGIEAAIALSIAYVAAENFWIREAKRRWILTFFFGLVHGFGFANVLADLGLPRDSLIASLLAFNLGVEAGQVCIVALLFPVVLYWTRGQGREPVWAVSGVILCFGLGWFLERVFDLSFMPF